MYTSKLIKTLLHVILNIKQVFCIYRPNHVCTILIFCGIAQPAIKLSHSRPTGHKQTNFSQFKAAKPVTVSSI